jgi:hydrogenase maturation protease
MNSQNIFLLLEKKLQQLFQNYPKLLILGIGENRMGDDGAGQYISFNLDQQIRHDNVKIINGGIVPEERISEILDFQPNLLLLIDAVDSQKIPGDVNFYEEQQMLNYLPISSHSLPLPIFVDRCKSNIPGLEVKLLGIQPYSLEFLDRYELFEEETYSLDDKENDPNIPFYNFNLTEGMQNICDRLIPLIAEQIKVVYGFN